MGEMLPRGPLLSPPFRRLTDWMGWWVERLHNKQEAREEEEEREDKLKDEKIHNTNNGATLFNTHSSLLLTEGSFPAFALEKEPQLAKRKEKSIKGEDGNVSSPDHRPSIPGTERIF